MGNEVRQPHRGFHTLSDLCAVVAEMRRHMLSVGAGIDLTSFDFGNSYRWNGNEMV